MEDLTAMLNDLVSVPLRGSGLKVSDFGRTFRARLFPSPCGEVV